MIDKVIKVIHVLPGFHAGKKRGADMFTKPCKERAGRLDGFIAPIRQTPVNDQKSEDASDFVQNRTAGDQSVRTCPVDDRQGRTAFFHNILIKHGKGKGLSGRIIQRRNLPFGVDQYRNVSCAFKICYIFKLVFGRK